MYTHLEIGNILTDLNHGFYSEYSCEMQVITTVNDFLTCSDNHKQVEIAKAFNTAPHGKLLHKLQQYSLHELQYSWLTCFHAERKMHVVLEESPSESVPVDLGVPQGTMLGPLLFLCHISFNDLPDAVNSKVHPFTNKCLLSWQINTFMDHHILQEDLKWLETG